MKRALFMQDGIFAVKMGFLGGSEELLAIAKEIRKSCACIEQEQNEAISPMVSFVIPSWKLKELGFEIVENYTEDAGEPIPVLSDGDGNCQEGPWEVHALDDVESACLELTREGQIELSVECREDDGNLYHLSAEMKYGEFCDALEKMALLSEKDSENKKQ